jgi:hypothetical protein
MPFDFPEAGADVPASGTTKGEAMSLKPYDVTINGTETTLMLSDEHAKAQGLLKAEPKTDAKKAPAPANKARKAPNKKG